MYIGQWHLSPLQRRNLGTSHTSPNYHQLPHHIFLNLIDCLINTLPVQRWFWFREMSEVAGSQIWIVGGWTTWVIWCFTKNSVLDKIYEWAHCHDEAANHQLPIAMAFWIIWIVSRRGMSKLNTKFYADSLFYSLNHFECDGHTVYMLTQWRPPPPHPD